MKYRVSLVKVKSLNLPFGNQDKDKHKLVKQSDRVKIGTIFEIETELPIYAT